MPETGCAASQSLCMYMHCAIFKTCICYNFNLFYIFNKLKKCCYISMKTQISTEEGTKRRICPSCSLRFLTVFINLLSSADWTLSVPTAVRNPGGKTASWLSYSTCSIGHYLSGEKVYAPPTNPLSSYSVMPPWLPNCHNTMVKATEGGMNFPQASLCMTSFSSHFFKLPSG